MYLSSGVTTYISGSFAICSRRSFCLLLQSTLYETEFGGLRLFCCKMLNIDSSHFDILVNKVLEYIFMKVQT